MLNDEPAVIDGLARAALVRSVGDRIHACHPPQVFGISGDWGSGKTSFLRQLQCYVSGRCGVRPTWKPVADESHPQAGEAVIVWFEAWRYQNEERPVIALLHEIRQQLSAAQKIFAKGKKLTEVAFRAALTLFDDTTKQIGFSGLSKIQDVGELYEAKRYETLLGVEDIRRHLEYAINQLLSNGLGKGPERRLVVLIDDLDRCHPQAATKLLEGLKIFLNLQNCVFVLGMNQAIIEQGIALTYKDLPVDRYAVAHEYLEKICQNIWHLPMPGNSADFLQASLEAIAKFPPSRGDRQGRANFFTAIVEVVKEERVVAPNPRRVKAFANLLERMYEHHPVRYLGDSAKNNAQIALVFAFLYLSDQPVYRILQTSPDFYRTRLLIWARNPKHADVKDHPALQRLKPTSNSNIDLDKLPIGATIPLVDLYPDPAEEGVMRVQKLIDKLGSLEDDEIARYLLQ